MRLGVDRGHQTHLDANAIRPDVGRQFDLVAVNGGTSGWEALDWAAAEAAARRSPLRIVHVVVPLAAMFDPLGGTGPIWADPDASEAGAQVVDEAVRRARQIAPDTTVTTSLTCGTVSAAIRAAGRDRALTVIGRSRPRRLGIAAASLRIAAVPLDRWRSSDSTGDATAARRRDGWSSESTTLVDHLLRSPLHLKPRHDAASASR